MRPLGPGRLVVLRYNTWYDAVNHSNGRPHRVVRRTVGLLVSAEPGMWVVLLGDGVMVECQSETWLPIEVMFSSVDKSPGRVP
jgi:hypothetical protein